VYLFFVEVEIVECNQMLTQSDGLVLSTIHQCQRDNPEYKEGRAILESATTRQQNGLETGYCIQQEYNEKDHPLSELNQPSHPWNRPISHQSTREGGRRRGCTICI